MAKARLYVAATAVVGLGAVLAACGNNSSASSTKQELNLVQNLDPTTLDVNDERNVSEVAVMNATQEGLFRTESHNGKDKLVLAGAKSYHVSADGLTYTFKLRDSKWSDGKVVTAQQYVDSILRELNPKNAFAHASSAYAIKGAEAYNTGKGTAAQVGVAAPDSKTLTITLAYKDSYFTHEISNVYFYPVRLDLIKKVGNTAWKTAYKKQVSNGPFKYSAWKKNDKLVLVKNNKYWNAKKVKLQKVTYTTTTKDSTILSLMQSGQLDAITASGAQASDFDQLTKNNKITKITQPGARIGFVIFNQHTGGLSGLLQNTKIRQALSLSINRSDYNKAIADGQDNPATNFVPKSVTVGNTNFYKYTGNVLAKAQKQYNSKAKLQALFQEGLKELGKSTDLNAVTLTFLSPGEDTADIGPVIKQQLEKTLGIHVTVKIQPDAAAFSAARDKNDYDLLANGWSGGSDPSTFLTLWQSTNGFQRYFGGYNSKTYDDLYAQLENADSNADRLKIFAALQDQLVAKDYGVAATTSSNSRIFVSKSVKDLQTPVFGTPFNYNYAYKK
ncbi:MAG: peptide ABC transporter substrate-binding protein [Lactobacillus sp.]|jgi:oligopeptide transport system substrate-binding protein|nr:peptide ABC transporter substrate-binding protein [Lactobacillus sp.]MCI2033350.1 peptide ABC transporter substrate-binding protein [Lactobacillus sp.]